MKADSPITLPPPVLALRGQCVCLQMLMLEITKVIYLVCTWSLHPHPGDIRT
jgi:hypothetical protein